MKQTYQQQFTYNQSMQKQVPSNSQVMKQEHLDNLEPLIAENGC